MLVATVEFVLDTVETRVLGCLVEKDLSTPEYYPLTRNALLNACNQKSNREPVMSFDEESVEEALASLRAKRLVSTITGPSLRVAKHQHRLGEAFNLGRRELAILCELMVRGRQTPGELNSRTQRLYEFSDIGEVETTIERLIEWQPAPLIQRLPRAPGTKEPRYAQLLSGAVAASELTEAPATAPSPRREIEEEVRRLRDDLDKLRQEFEAFRGHFE